MQYLGFCGVFVIVLGILGTIGFALITFFIVRSILKSRDRLKAMRKMKPYPVDKLKKIQSDLEENPVYIELAGETACFFPIKTPLSDTDAIYCELKVEQLWIEQGDEKNSKVLVMEKTVLNAPFRFSDGTGIIDARIRPGVELNVKTVNSKVFDAPQLISKYSFKSFLDKSKNEENQKGRFRENTTGEFDEDAFDYGYNDQIRKENPCQNSKYDNGKDEKKKIGYRYTESYIPVNASLHFLGYVSFKSGHFYLQPGDEISFISDKPKEDILLILDKEKSRNFGCLFLIVAVIVLTSFLFIGITEWFWETSHAFVGLFSLIVAYAALSSLVVLTHFDVFWDDLKRVGRYFSGFFIK